MSNEAQKSQRRRELAEFLRSRRERIKPADVGIVNAARRRTPGLRREEVAEIAGVGATWYTWLEQARDIQPSDEVLERLAVALRLNVAEIEHLFALAGRAHSRKSDLGVKAETVPPTLQRFIDHFTTSAAVVLGRRWDILAANAQAEETFLGMRELPAERRNWVYMVFCTPGSKSRLVDWERNARRVMAEFHLSVAGLLDSPWVAELVDDLKAKSAEFRSWWDEHDVRDLSTAAFQLRATDDDRANYERLAMFPTDGDGLRLVLYMPK